MSAEKVQVPRGINERVYTPGWSRKNAHNLKRFRCCDFQYTTVVGLNSGGKHYLRFHFVKSHVVDFIITDSKSYY